MTPRAPTGGAAPASFAPLPAAEADRLIAIAQAAADLAGGIIRPHFRASLAVDDKTDDSPVTIADRGAEQAMRALLTERCPEDGVLGEEFGLERAHARRRWVLDPIDGTRAFITGRPVFGTLIGLLEGDTPILGLIDQPITGERWIGIAGQPTRFRAPFGGRPGTRACATLEQAELSCTSPDMFRPEDRPRFNALAAAARRVSWGGDCYAYGLLALGQIDVIAEATLKPWDWAALVPVIEGAGGRMTDWSGQPLRVDGDGCALAVGDPALLGPAVAALAAS